MKRSLSVLYLLEEMPYFIHDAKIQPIIGAWEKVRSCEEGVFLCRGVGCKMNVG